MAAPKKKKSGQKTARAPKAPAKVTRTLVTQSEYARHRDVSPERVRQWRVAGQLVTEGEGRALRVDVEASDRRIAKTRDPQQDLARKRHAARDAAGEPPDGERPDDESFEYWRTRKEAANAKLAEAKLKEEAGRLIDRASAVNATYAMANAFRTALLNVPAREAGQLAARCEIDEHDAREILDDIVRRYLDEQAGVALQMKSRAVEHELEDEDLDADADD